MSHQNRCPGEFNQVDVVQNKINKANSIDILTIFSIYNFHIDRNDKRSKCPFNLHKGGEGNPTSFCYYPDTNSYFCFSCKLSGRPVDFVSQMEDKNKYQSALLILNNFQNADYDFHDPNSDNRSNQNKFYLDFSHSVREFILLNKNDSAALVHAENATKAFDDIVHKYRLDDIALGKLITKIKSILERYQ